jgi:hypothetical protein
MGQKNTHHLPFIDVLSTPRKIIEYMITHTKMLHKTCLMTNTTSTFDTHQKKGNILVNKVMAIITKKKYQKM